MSIQVQAMETYNVRDFGAAGNGKTLDTAAIQKAIVSCEEEGGGQVLFPPGRYLTGTIHLRSHVSLVLQAGARIVGTTDLESYQQFFPPPGKPESNWSRWHRALIIGDNVEDVSLSGDGTIDGNKVFDPQGEERRRGPHTVILGHCRNVTIRDITVIDSANYAFLLEDSDHVEFRNVVIKGGWDGIHFRGWESEPCSHITITGCEFYTGDDSIAGRYWENVLISNCIINSSCNGIRLIGPATTLMIHDCLFYGPGLYEHRSSNRTHMLAAINLQPGGWDATRGALDDVMISDISMKNVAAPFHIVLKKGNTAGEILISRIDATGVYRSACTVESWAETPFQKVTFRHVNIQYKGGAKQRKKPDVKSPGVDPRPLPAWGFYAKNIKNLLLENVNLTWAAEDVRPVMICDSVQSLTLDDFSFARLQTPTKPFLLNNIKTVTVKNSTFDIVEFQCTELNIVPSHSRREFRAGDPFQVQATLQNNQHEGLAKIELVLDGQTKKQWLWLSRDQKEMVTFQDLSLPSPGTYPVRIGNISKNLVVVE